MQGTVDRWFLSFLPWLSYSMRVWSVPWHLGSSCLWNTLEGYVNPLHPSFDGLIQERICHVHYVQGLWEKTPMKETWVKKTNTERQRRGDVLGCVTVRFGIETECRGNGRAAVTYTPKEGIWIYRRSMRQLWAPELGLGTSCPHH